MNTARTTLSCFFDAESFTHARASHNSPNQAASQLPPPRELPWPLYTGHPVRSNLLCSLRIYPICFHYITVILAVRLKSDFVTFFVSSVQTGSVHQYLPMIVIELMALICYLYPFSLFIWSCLEFFHRCDFKKNKNKILQLSWCVRRQVGIKIH